MLEAVQVVVGPNSGSTDLEQYRGTDNFISVTDHEDVVCDLSRESATHSAVTVSCGSYKRLQGRDSGVRIGCR